MSDTPKNHTSYVPLDCPVCENMMRDVADSAQYHIAGCCVDCWIGFLEPLRIQTRDDGYLPSIAEIASYREKIRNLGTEKANA